MIFHLMNPNLLNHFSIILYLLSLTHFKRISRLFQKAFSIIEKRLVQE